MAKRKIKLAIKAKKKWFTAVAPAVYKNAEIAEIAAFEPKNLIGRCVHVSLAHVTGTPKDQSKKVTFKITDTRGEKALTEPTKYNLQDGFIQRSSRRFKERIISVLKIKTKDNKTAKIKLLMLVANKLPRAIKTELAKKLEDYVNNKISKTNGSDLFIPAALDKLAMELKRELKSVYPTNRIVVWKLTLS